MADNYEWDDEEKGKILDQPHPEGYLEEWERKLSKAKEVGTIVGHVPLLMFRCGDTWFGVSPGRVSEVVDSKVINPIPHCQADGLVGIVTINGRVELAVSFLKVLGITVGDGVDDGKISKRMLVMEWKNIRWVYDVDEVHGVHVFDYDDMELLEGVEYQDRFFKGSYEYEGRKVLWIDEDIFLYAVDRRFLRKANDE